MTIAVTARDAPRRLAFATMVVFAVWADFGFGIRSELIAPSDTNIPAVNAAQRAPWVIASYRIERTAGTFLPNRARKDGSIPPESPELRAAVNATLCCTLKLAVLVARSATPTVEIWATRTAPITAIPKAEPICLTVLFAPDPTPAFCHGILCKTVLVSWLIARPTPAP